MRAFLRFLVLFLLVLAYGTQAVAQVRHLHVGEERHHCTACVFGSLPGEPTATLEKPLPPECFLASAIESPELPPAPSLEILDVSSSTSPPVV